MTLLNVKTRYGESAMSCTSFVENRSHRRLDIRLPLEYHKEGVGRCNVFRTVTINVSTGGVYFETAADDIQVGDCLSLQLAVPADDGRFPPNGKISTVAKVVRTKAINDPATKKGLPFTRYGVAAQFEQGLKLAF